jgi:hypothetical protein
LSATSVPLERGGRRPQVASLVLDWIPLLVRGGLGLVVGLLAGRRQVPTHLRVRPSACRFEHVGPDDLCELLRLGAGVDWLA